MADYGILFTLVLVAFTFVIVGMCFIVYMMMMSEREKRSRAEDMSPPRDALATAKCLHQFGYLSGYPLDQPIPEECFGCTKALRCMNQKTLPIEAKIAQLAQVQKD